MVLVLKSILKNPADKKPSRKLIQRVKFQVEDTIQEFETPESPIPTTDKPFNFVIKRIVGTLENKSQQKPVFDEAKGKKDQRKISMSAYLNSQSFQSQTVLISSHNPMQLLIPMKSRL